MWTFLQMLGTVLKAVVLPVGQGIKTIARGIRWALHFVLLALILIGLYVLNWALGIDQKIPNPVWARHIWLPIFFLAIYALGWMAWWLYKLLIAEAEASHFPDIDLAWEEASQALAHAGIRLSDVPIFLILGKTEAAIENLFNAGQLNLVVKQTPAHPNAPLHVFANRDAIYLTCEGASLLGRQATILAMEEFAESEAPLGEGDDIDEGKTLKPGEKEKEIKRVLMRTTGQATARERRAMRREAGLQLPDLLKNHVEVEEHTARLAHFCRLLVRDRHPFCPLNGMLVLVPLGSSDTDTDVHATAECCTRDIATIRRVTKTLCPMLGLVCDLETLPGFPEFLQGQDQRDRLRRLGQRYPFLPDLTFEQYLESVTQSVAWLGEMVIPQWVYKLFRLESPDREEWSDVTTRNAQLFLMLEELRERGQRLGRVVSQGLARNGEGLYAGCYLAGTGAGKETGQGFVAGVFRRLIEGQNLVSWTDKAFADDERDHRIATTGYVLIGVFAVAFVGAVAWFFTRDRG